MDSLSSTTCGTSPYAGAGHSPKSDEQQIAAAQKALSKANDAVAQDKQHNSPGCAVTDQKVADQAAAVLANATTQARTDGVLDVTA